MLYRPKFCCNCGEKIERTDWRIFTSRRFCDICAIEQKGNELFPRVMVSIALVFGVFGIGSFFRDPSANPMDSERKFSNPAALRRGIIPDRTFPDQTVKAAETEAGETQSIAGFRIDDPVAAQAKEQPKIRRSASDGPEYYCGALTKKGKPCSRRVRSNGRCWQHTGQPPATVSKRQSDEY